MLTVKLTQFATLPDSHAQIRWPGNEATINTVALGSSAADLHLCQPLEEGDGGGENGAHKIEKLWRVLQRRTYSVN